MSSIMPQFTSRISKNVYSVIRNPKLRLHEFSAAAQKNEKKITTIDNKDIKHHTELADSWWDVYGNMRALHALNYYRIPFIRDGLVKTHPENTLLTPLSGKKVLDIGCGGGIASMALAELGADVTGVDASDELIKIAQQRCETNPPVSGKKPTFVCTSIEEHATDYADTYDGVVASEIIEHIDNDKKELFVKSSIQTLKPGGRIFFTAPSRTRMSQLTNIFIIEYILRAIPIGTHQYEKFMTPDGLKALLERNGCQVEVIKGLFYYPLQNKWKWNNTTNFFFALQAVKLSGNIANQKS